MAYALHVHIVKPGGGLSPVEHVFYAETEEETESIFEAHAAGCEFLGPAVAEERVIEELETGVGIPTEDDFDDDEDEEPEDEEEEGEEAAP